MKSEIKRILGNLAAFIVLFAFSIFMAMQIIHKMDEMPTPKNTRHILRVTYHDTDSGLVVTKVNSIRCEVLLPYSTLNRDEPIDSIIKEVILNQIK